MGTILQASACYQVRGEKSRLAMYLYMIFLLPLRQQKQEFARTFRAEVAYTW